MPKGYIITSNSASLTFSSAVIKRPMCFLHYVLKVFYLSGIKPFRALYLTNFSYRTGTRFEDGCGIITLSSPTKADILVAGISSAVVEVHSEHFFLLQNMHSPQLQDPASLQSIFHPYLLA